MGSNAYIYFPKTDSLKGSAENDEVKGKNATAILSVSHSLNMPVTGADAGGQARLSGRAVFGDIIFSKYVDEITPYLNQMCAGGNIIPTAVLTWFSTGQNDSTIAAVNLLEITLSNVVFTTVSYSGTGGGDLPIETVGMNYTQIQWKQIEMSNVAPGKAGAAVTTTWDLHMNTK